MRAPHRCEIERILANTARSFHGCWPNAPRPQQARETLWRADRGPIPRGRRVVNREGCHARCVRPLHLRLNDPKPKPEPEPKPQQSVEWAFVAPKPKPKPKPRGGGNSRLTEEQVREIREEAARGVVQRSLARKYNISTQAISNIVTRKSWGWLT